MSETKVGLSVNVWVEVVGFVRSDLLDLEQLLKIGTVTDRIPNPVKYWDGQDMETWPADESEHPKCLNGFLGGSRTRLDLRKPSKTQTKPDVFDGDCVCRLFGRAQASLFIREGEGYTQDSSLITKV